MSSGHDERSSESIIMRAGVKSNHGQRRGSKDHKLFSLKQSQTRSSESKSTQKFTKHTPRWTHKGKFNKDTDNEEDTAEFDEQNNTMMQTVNDSLIMDKPLNPKGQPQRFEVFHEHEVNMTMDQYNHRRPENGASVNSVDGLIIPEANIGTPGTPMKSDERSYRHDDESISDIMNRSYVEAEQNDNASQNTMVKRQIFDHTYSYDEKTTSYLKQKDGRKGFMYKKKSPPLAERVR